ncbi:4-hydroxybenzoate octaprenyltransferase [Motiliproteus sp. MSK22-1]|uniref:4-hydroxybenzoate octaprenyltransferase n=1 Tax=Motiliproteus sp. MSK22-1 TaxID=1897630 RepID=UPI0009776FCA|nr:4-hydroxybenzoate octaprenyltransferase [Motiliproteus sp. MSK22-1]OMH28040.1 4-hydroxybenzoate polyprenyltransferase [Motiliproteus sp. MSK22-1]
MEIIRQLNQDKLLAYIQLMRVNKPIGIYLLLWPTLWALWVAAEGIPDTQVLIIFVLGVVVMRSAGCVINDYADRKVDGHVSRTKDRPLPSGRVTEKEALGLFGVLCLFAFVLVLFTNKETVMLSVGGLFLAACYPFMKRYTYLPQVVLGAAFAWAVPMAFTAQTGTVTQQAWLIYAATLLWTVAYDTLYAMVDREDDLKIGIKSTAILFGEADKMIVGVLQGMVILTLLLLGQQLSLGFTYYMGVVAASGLFVYQQWLIRKRETDRCFEAFLNNHWVGSIVFAGLFLDYLVHTPAAVG